MWAARADLKVGATNDAKPCGDKKPQNFAVNVKLCATRKSQTKAKTAGFHIAKPCATQTTPARSEGLAELGVAPAVGAEFVGGFDADADAVEFERNGIVRLPCFDEDHDGGFAGIVEAGGDADAENAGLLHERSGIFVFHSFRSCEIGGSGSCDAGREGSGFFHECGGGSLINRAGFRKRVHGDDARGNSGDVVRNGADERLAFAHEKNHCGAIGTVKAASDSDGEKRRMQRHELRRVLIFYVFGCGELRGGRRGGRLRGSVECVVAGRGAAGDGSARGGTDESRNVWRCVGVAQIVQDGLGGRADCVGGRASVKQRDGLSAGLRDDERAGVSRSAEGAAVEADLVYVSCSEGHASQAPGVFHGNVGVS